MVRNLDIHKRPKQRPVAAAVTAVAAVTATPLVQPIVVVAVPQLQVEAKPKARSRFRGSYVGVPVAIFFLTIGTIIGSRFVNFANSVTLSRAGLAQTVTSEIGATAGTVIPALSKLDTTPVAEAIRGQKSVNVLLLGYGGDGHSGAYLTDSMVVVHMDFQTGKTTLISVPRDLWVEIPTGGASGSDWKINAAYELGLNQGPSGGGSMAKDVVSQVTGLQVDYFVAVDFTGFEDVINTLGGIDVDVANTFTDYTYPTSDATASGPSCTGDDQSTDCRYMVVHFDAGEQHMDGATALEYARSRHSADNGEGSDFARSARQQKVLVAVEQKAESLGILPKIFSLMDDVQGHFSTDLSIPEIQDLATYLEKNSLASATQVGLSTANYLVSGTSADGQYILTPAAGQDNYVDIQAYVQQEINSATSASPSNASTSTQN